MRGRGLRRAALLLVWCAGVMKPVLAQSTAPGSAAASAPAPAATATVRPLLGPLFVDHAVLQRDRPLRLWGEAAPGQAVEISLHDTRVTATADGQGAWHTELPAQPAGGPWTLTARAGDREQVVNDVLIGDVWLCSGQSNMQMGVRGAINGFAEIAASADPRIRQLTVPMVTSTTPRQGFEAPLAWKIAARDTTAEFSAACYFFVRELIKSEPVAQGMIVAAWGGTKIAPWMSEAALRRLGVDDERLEVLATYRRDVTAAAAQWGTLWQRWWLEQSALTQGRKPWLKVRGDERDWRAVPAGFTPWETWGVPELANYNGIVWYRAAVRLTAAQAKLPATLSLGQVDEIDLSFVNGRAVGASGCCPERSYAVPAGLLKAGDNLVVVKDLDTYMNGGMTGPAEKRALLFSDGTRVPLTGWQYQVAPVGLPTPPRAPWEATAGTSLVYNAMIAPLRNYSLRGVAWYQGESSAYPLEARAYPRALAELMADWRAQFEAPLPFLIVQLPGYGAMAAAPVDSAWALLRDAQRRAVAQDPNTALVVTLDIGNRDDVHPTNKQEVGRRLARAARRLVFGEAALPAGARPVSARRVAGRVQIQFVDFVAPLTVYNARDPAAFEVCGDAPGSCRFVTAHLDEGGRVTLEPPPDAPAAITRVRYGWADTPICNLFEGDARPVGPFEIPVQPTPGG